MQKRLSKGRETFPFCLLLLALQLFFFGRSSGYFMVGIEGPSFFHFLFFSFLLFLFLFCSSPLKKLYRERRIILSDVRQFRFPSTPKLDKLYRVRLDRSLHPYLVDNWKIIEIRNRDESFLHIYILRIFHRRRTNTLDGMETCKKLGW